MIHSLLKRVDPLDPALQKFKLSERVVNPITRSIKVKTWLVSLPFSNHPQKRNEESQRCRTGPPPRAGEKTDNTSADQHWSKVRPLVNARKV
jgi:hypothetical protein